VDALDDALDVPSRQHLAACAECQAELVDLRAVMTEARRVETPAPSPLFWDHFSERVREATAAQSLAPAARWWSGWMRPVGALAAVVGAVAFVVFLRPASPAPVNETASASYAAFEMPADDGSWGLVVGLAGELDLSDVRAVAAPAAGTVDAVLEDLTSAQRDALVRLLQKEMGDQ